MINMLGSALPRAVLAPIPPLIPLIIMTSGSEIYRRGPWTNQLERTKRAKMHGLE